MSIKEFGFNVEKVEGGFIIQGSYPVKDGFGLDLDVDRSFRRIVATQREVNGEMATWLKKVDGFPPVETLNG